VSISLDAAPQAARGKTGRNVAIGLVAAAAIGVAAFWLWYTNQAPGQIPSATSAAPLVVESAIPKTPAQDPAPAQPVADPALSPSVTPGPPKVPPGPTEASFELTTMPAGAEAVFDGNPGLHCTTPCILNLPVGRHTLVVVSKGYREAQRVFNLPSEPGLIMSLEASMGTLSLVTKPAGLAVIIDGQEQARKTPADFSLSVGEHRIQVLRGAEKQEFTAQIRDNVVSQKSIEWGQ